MAGRESVSQVISGYAFTMLGFLAAMITVLFAVSHSRVFREYRKGGYDDLFFIIYFIAIGTLILLAALALINLGGKTHEIAFIAMLMLVVNSSVQILLITLAITNLARRSISK